MRSRLDALRHTIRAIASDADAYATEADAKQDTTRIAAVVAVTAALSLTMINFYAKRTQWVPELAEAVGINRDGIDDWLYGRATSELAGLTVWTLVQLVAYVGLPLVAIRFLKLPTSGFGIRWRGIASGWKPYAVLFAVSFPIIVWASYAASFQSKYPFYDLRPGEGLWPNMYIWWVLYALQFVALEFFFRGFLVHGLKYRMGFAAVFVMIIPYNMIHFQKPLLEAVGAIAGGVTLGTLSLKTNSVWWGAALHIAVAATMDIAALMHKGLL